MLPIVEVKMFLNAKMASAKFLRVVSAFDDLENSVIFEYFVMASPTENLGTGKVTFTGDDYLDWDGSKQKAHEMVAERLGFEIEEQE